VIASRDTTALPGIVIPITSAGISIIISSYATNLRRQMRRVLEYSEIVNKDEELLHTLAYNDALSGLPNRKKILDQIDLLTNPANQNTQGFELVYLDLDNFKKINDTMGHSVGDAILKQVAERWKEKCHPQDILGRVGGDEFIILICHKLNDEELSEYLIGFGEALKGSIIVERKEFFVSASYGVTRYPTDAQSAGELIKNADIALYRAKNLGKNNYMFFNMQMQEDVSKRIQLENGLLSAIRNNELFMLFQPQYEGKSGKLRGYEALVRWRHPELGLVSPMEFIPIAEETGIINEIGRWIIETVLIQFMEIKRKWDMRVIVSINISVAQMLEPSFIHMIKEILLETGYDSNYLEFEITESVFITSPDYITEVIRQLKAMGIRIALDDFGTGYASLNFFKCFRLIFSRWIKPLLIILIQNILEIRW
jgi:diguanylate cyclase (GGDEF)-like protein